MDPPILNHRWRQTIAATILGLVLAGPLAAQSITLPAEGTRIRVRTAAAPEKWISGTLGAQTSEGLWIDEKVLQRESITHIEVSEGRKSRFLTGLVIGTAAGVAAGLVLRDEVRNSSDGSLGGELFSNAAAAGTLPVLTVLGAVVGGVAGALTHTDRWRAFSTDRVNVALAPTSRGGLGVGVGVSF